MGKVTWGGMDAVRRFKKRAQQRHDRWEELKALAHAGQVQQFYAKYAEYLEWDNVVSESREVLLLMARAVASLNEESPGD